MRPRRHDTYWLDDIGGIYYAVWYDPVTKATGRKSLRTRDRHEANLGLARLIVGGNVGGSIAGGHAGVTVVAVLDAYLRQHVVHKAADPVRQENAITHLKAYFGDKKMRDVSVAESRAYAEARSRGTIGGGKRRRDGVDEDGNLIDRLHLRQGGPSTIRRELNVLVAAANHAIKWELLPAAEAPRVELPGEVRHTDPPWLPKDLLKAVFAAADAQAEEAARQELELRQEAAELPLRRTPKAAKRLRTAEERIRQAALYTRTCEKLAAFVRIAYFTAGRRESIERLRKTQVDLQHGRVNLHAPGRPVTKKRRPIVPLYPEIRPVIELWMARSSTEFVFGERTDLYRPFARLLRRKFGIAAHPHMLRHSRATHMLMDGEDPYKVAKLLGDTLATVERVYGHHSVEYLATASTVEDVA